MNGKPKVFDGISRDAVDGLAKRVAGPGERYEANVKVTCAHWVAPPPLREPPDNAPKLKGLKFGRFEVVGLLREVGPKYGKWVVRCSCGDYELRTAKAIRNPNNFGDRCTICRKAATDLKSYEFHKHGRVLDMRNL